MAPTATRERWPCVGMYDTRRYHHRRRPLGVGMCVALQEAIEYKEGDAVRREEIRAVWDKRSDSGVCHSLDPARWMLAVPGMERQEEGGGEDAEGEETGALSRPLSLSH